VCQLTVHAACYNQPDDMVKLSQRKMWNCERCSSTSRVTPVCVFCNEKRLEMPFMKTTDGRWAHISCGQCINEAFFSGDKNEIDVSHVKWAPRTQVCLICDKKRGICIQCAWPKCAKYHHLACARAEGLHSFLNQQTFNVNTFCAAHTAEKRRKMMRRKTSNGKGISPCLSSVSFSS
jgi:NuA3 HAT complex component NTO1